MHDIVITGAELEHELLADLIAEIHPERVLLRPSEPALRLEGVERTADLKPLREAAERLQADFFRLPAGLSVKSFRAFFFDMDGTLIENECIDDMARAAGCLAEVEKVTRATMEGRLSFTESLEGRVAHLKGSPLSVIDHAVEAARPAHGAAELMKFAKRAGVDCYVVSGGFTAITRPVAKRLGMTGAVSNELEVRDDRLTGVVRGSAGGRILDADGKRRAVEVLAQLHGCSLKEVLCCGDGANDLEMVRAAGIGVAYHAKPVLRTAAAQQINHSGLEAVMLFFREAWRDAVPLG